MDPQHGRTPQTRVTSSPSVAQSPRAGRKTPVAVPQQRSATSARCADPSSTESMAPQFAERQQLRNAKIAELTANRVEMTKAIDEYCRPVKIDNGASELYESTYAAMLDSACDDLRAQIERNAEPVAQTNATTKVTGELLGFAEALANAASESKDRDVVDELTEKLQNLRVRSVGRLDAVNTNVERGEQAFAVTEGSLGRLGRALGTGFRGALNSLERMLEFAEARMTAREQAVQRDFQLLTDKAAFLERELQAVERENEALEGEVKLANENAVELHRKLEELTAQEIEAEAAVQRANGELAVLQAEAETAEANLADVSLLIDSTHKQIDDADEMAKGVEEEVLQLNEAIALLTSAMNEDEQTEDNEEAYYSMKAQLARAMNDLCGEAMGLQDALRTLELKSDEGMDAHAYGALVSDEDERRTANEAVIVELTKQLQDCEQQAHSLDLEIVRLDDAVKEEERLSLEKTELQKTDKHFEAAKKELLAEIDKQRILGNEMSERCGMLTRAASELNARSLGVVDSHVGAFVDGTRDPSLVTGRLTFLQNETPPPKLGNAQLPASPKTARRMAVVVKRMDVDGENFATSAFDDFEKDVGERPQWMDSLEALSPSPQKPVGRLDLLQEAETTPAMHIDDEATSGEKPSTTVSEASAGPGAGTLVADFRMQSSPSGDDLQAGAQLISQLMDEDYPKVPPGYDSPLSDNDGADDNTELNSDFEQSAWSFDRPF